MNPLVELNKKLQIATVPPKCVALSLEWINPPINLLPFGAKRHPILKYINVPARQPVLNAYPQLYIVSFIILSK